MCQGKHDHVLASLSSIQCLKQRISFSQFRGLFSRIISQQTRCSLESLSLQLLDNVTGIVHLLSRITAPNMRYECSPSSRLLTHDPTLVIMQRSLCLVQEGPDFDPLFSDQFALLVGGSVTFRSLTSLQLAFTNGYATPIPYASSALLETIATSLTRLRSLWIHSGSPTSLIHILKVNC